MQLRKPVAVDQAVNREAVSAGFSSPLSSTNIDVIMKNEEASNRFKTLQAGPIHNTPWLPHEIATQTTPLVYLLSLGFAWTDTAGAVIGLRRLGYLSSVFLGVLIKDF